MRKITLQIIPAAISCIGARWNAAVNKGSIASLMRDAVIWNKHNDGTPSSSFDSELSALGRALIFSSQAGQL